MGHGLGVVGVGWDSAGVIGLGWGMGCDRV